MGSTANQTQMKRELMNWKIGLKISRMKYKRQMIKITEKCIRDKGYYEKT